MNEQLSSNECVHPWVSIVLLPRTHCAACGFNFATPPEIDNLTRDRDEWREQHERLVAVREQDLKVMQARIDAMLTGGKYQTGTDDFKRMWAVLDELDRLRAADEPKARPDFGNGTWESLRKAVLRLQQSRDFGDAATVQEVLDYLERAAQPPSADRADAERWRTLQKLVDENKVFSVYEYSTKVFDLAGAIDRK